MPNSVFSTLNGLRGAAAITVVTLHASHLFGGAPFPNAYLAVDVFFVLSGVVLARAYEPRFAAGMTPSVFMVVRGIRLLPLFMLGMLLASALIVVAKLTGKTDLSNSGMAIALLTNPFMLPSPIWWERPPLFVLNTPAWSLAFEFLVNALYVLIFPWLTAGRLSAIIGISAIVLVYGVMANGDADLGSTWVTLGYAFPRVIFSFFLGVAIARLPTRTAVTSSAQAWLILVFLLLVLAIPTSHHVLFDLACILVAFPLIVLVGMRCEPGPRSGAIFTLMGVTSYAIYIIHYPLIEGLRGSINKLGSGVNTMTPWIGIGFVAVLLALCWLADRYYDIPVRKHLARIASRAANPQRVEIKT